MSPKTLFVSDVHLSAQQPQIAELFQQFLEDKGVQAARLYILGDLFDVWIGDDHRSSFYQKIEQQLYALSQKGVKIYFMAGNRDFLVGKTFAKKSGCTLLTEPTLIELPVGPTLLMHGDLLCTEDKAYQSYRKKARHPVVMWGYKRLPLTTREKIAQNLREKSKAHQRQQLPDIMDVTPKTVESYFEQYKVKHFIHGHVHRPKVHEHQLAHTRATRYVMGDWHQVGSYLEADENGIELKTYA